MTVLDHEPLQEGPAASAEQDPPDGEVVLRVSGLTKRFGSRAAVEGLNLEVTRGEVFGFLGPNGAGKTTTISMILGLVAPSAGEIEILGHDLHRSPREALACVGAIVETSTFYPYLSGIDNLRVMALARGGVPERRFDETLKLVGLKGREHDKYKTYSLGMKQRLGIAGALLHQPDLLILDEPSNGLDPAGIVEIRNLILELAREGQTIVLCSHMLSEVQQVCDRAMILASGKVAAVGNVDSLMSRGAKTVLRVDDLLRAEGVLRGVPWIEGVERLDGKLLISMPADRDFSLGQLLHQHGLIVAEMQRQDRGLEQYFLEVTVGSGPAA